MEKMEVINVGLYGGKGLFGGRETKLEASVISCNMHESCSLFKNNQCVRVRSLGNQSCAYGKEETVVGYTSKAKKYHDFRNKWKNHEAYGMLKHPPAKLGAMGDFVFFPYPHVGISETEKKELKLVDPWKINRGKQFIELERFDVDFIHRLCSFKPQAMMGGEISKYQKEVVPSFMTHLAEVMPDLYEAFTTAHPEFSGKIDHVGRKAYLKTLNPSPILDANKNYPNLDSAWYWDGELLTYTGGHISRISVIKDYEIENIVIRPTDKSVVTVADNNQVNQKTVFVD